MGLLKEFSIQLYSVRDELEKDFVGTLEKVSKIGYTGVEFAGYGNISAKEMKRHLANFNLKSIGTHAAYDLLINNLEEVITYNSEIGTEYIVCPWIQPELFKNRSDVLKIAEQLRPVCEKVSASGMKFAYHNHAQELAKDGDEYLLNILFDNLDKQKACMELDLFWIAYAGVDVMNYITANKDIVTMLHLKQIKDLVTKKQSDLGDGYLNFKEIIEKTLPLGIEHYVLEQEEYDVSSLVSVENGFKHIMSL